jgi:hypothetical protein
LLPPLSPPPLPSPPSYGDPPFLERLPVPSLQSSVYFPFNTSCFPSTRNVFSSPVANVEYSSPSRRRFGVRVSVYTVAAAVPTGGLHDAAIYAAGDDNTLSPPPISTSPSDCDASECHECPFLAIESPASVNGVIQWWDFNCGGSIKIHTTIKLGIFLGWDGVGDLQRQRGRWNNQQNNFVVWDCRNLTINQKIKNMIKNSVSPLFIFLSICCYLLDN